ncbi:hypothetical protein Tco_0145731 [Tanacetum coccineum]
MWSVFKGVLQDGTLIVVKQLSSKSKQGNKEFLNKLGVIVWHMQNTAESCEVHGIVVYSENQFCGFMSTWLRVLGVLKLHLKAVWFASKREALLDDKRTAKLHSEKEVQDRNNVLKWKLKNLEENLQQFSFAFL